MAQVALKSNNGRNVLYIYVCMCDCALACLSPRNDTRKSNLVHLHWIETSSKHWLDPNINEYFESDAPDDGAAADDGAAGIGV